ncbi:MAG: hypothetical protein WC337_08985 [Candidatus Muiribacteriota bacterium]|jgi:long-subunit fatty acid transport protein
MKKKFFILILLCFLISVYAEFEETDVSVASMALAGAGSAFINDAQCIHINPAMLADLKKGQIYSFHTQAFSIDELSTSFNAMAHYIPRMGAFAVSSLDFGKNDYRENTYSFTFATNMFENSNFGINIKQLRSNIVNTDRASATSFDIGFTGVLANTDYAFSVKNLNAPTVNETVPRILQLGFKMKNSEKAYTFFDLSKVDSYGDIKGKVSIRLGKFFQLGDNFYAMCGYSSNPYRIAGGFKFEIGSKWVVDYAFSATKDLSPAHAVAFRMNI